MFASEKYSLVSLGWTALRVQQGYPLSYCECRCQFTERASSESLCLADYLIALAIAKQLQIALSFASLFYLTFSPLPLKACPIPWGHLFLNMQIFQPEHWRKGILSIMLALSPGIVQQKVGLHLIFSEQMKGLREKLNLGTIQGSLRGGHSALQPICLLSWFLYM